MSIKRESRGKSVGDYRAAALAAGSLLAALAASSCCILPLVLFSLGVSGAWVGSFTPLAAYQPIFIVATLACLGAGAWLSRRTARGCMQRGRRLRPCVAQTISQGRTGRRDDARCGCTRHRLLRATSSLIEEEIR